MLQSKRHKGGSIIHLIYLCIIFLIVLISVIICMSRESISETAMNNISFTSAIVSVVLALVSIFVSLYASNNTGQNLGSMKDIESRLRNAV